MNLVTVQKLAKGFSTRTLFHDVSFTIGERERVGLVGANGSGKTTLLKLLSGEDTPDEGSVAFASQCRVGVMEQDFARMQPYSALDAALDVFADIMALEAELELVNRQLDSHSADHDALVRKQHALQERHAEAGGLTYRSRSRATLLGLGFSEPQLSQTVASLSGGEQAKLKLARLLLKRPPLLLLDEPTNHLDIPAMEWLEDLLRAYGGAMLVVSHDRWFLDRVTERTFLLDEKTLRIAAAPYTEAMRRFQTLDEHTARHAAHIRREMKRLEQIIAQQRQWNRERNIRMAESKQKVLDKLQKSLPMEKRETRAPNIRFFMQDESVDVVLRAHALCKAFDGRALFSGVALQVRAQDRLFIIGPNGSGKSTLLKILAFSLAPDAGVVEYGSRVQTGYYDQAQAGLGLGNTLLEEMNTLATTLTQAEVRNALAGMGFRGDDAHKTIAQLSGGERARICLLKLMLSPAHLLLLDEPTNHLDIVSREALEDALEHYEGALVVVSHDRYFMRRLGGRRMQLCEGGLIETEDFLPSSAGDAQQRTEGASYRDKKALEALNRKKQTQLKRAEEAILSLEQAIRETEAYMSAPDVASDYARLSEMNAQLEALNAQHDEQLSLWLSLQV